MSATGHAVGKLPALPAASLLDPQWSAPPAIGALMSTRLGGVSVGPYRSLNLGAGVGDLPAAVAENRRRVQARIGAPVIWPRLVHGSGVLKVAAADLARELPAADALWTDEAGLACAVPVADCLPVLLATRDGRAVAAAHAGWRGLAAGVLGHTVRALVEGCGCAAHDIVAWLGPCIGPRQFEVGADVLHAFGLRGGEGTAFVPRPRADGSMRWLADLPRLARQQLAQAGVRDVSGGGWCTVEDASSFFSFRRDGTSGRMAAFVWRRA